MTQAISACLLARQWGGILLGATGVVGVAMPPGGEPGLGYVEEAMSAREARAAIGICAALYWWAPRCAQRPCCYRT